MPTALEILLARLANQRNMPLPEPAAPMSLGPLSTDTTAAFGAQNPEPVMPRFTQPAQPDMNFVNQFAGPAPTAPVERAPSFVDKLSAVLGGIAGGPQYAEQIRQQRQEPVRQYERQREQYEDRRARGIELAERRAEREADRANRANELAYENQFKVWLSKNGDRSDEAKQKMAQMFTLERDARAARLEAEREQQRERRQKELEARQITSRFFTVSKNMALSRELGAYHSGLSDAPLSKAAAALDARIQQVGQARLGGGGGTGGGRGASSSAAKAIANMEAAKQAVISAVQRGDVRTERLLRRKLDAAVGQLARFPGQIEYGGGEWPWAKLVGGGQQAAPAQQPQAQPQAKIITRAEMQALGITEAQARAEGYTIQ